MGDLGEASSCGVEVIPEAGGGVVLEISRTEGVGGVEVVS